MKISNNPNSISIDFEDGQHFDLWQKHSIEDHFTNPKVPVGQRAAVGLASPFLLVGALTGCFDSEQTNGTQQNPGTNPGTNPDDYFVDEDDDGFQVCKPGAPADCSNYFVENPLQKDCDDSDDTQTAPSTWYLDSDGDGFGTSEAEPEVACEVPAGYADNDLDCDDANPDVQEGYVWYADADGDTYGDTDSPVLVCDDDTQGLVDRAGDCDDGDASINPGASETDGLADEDCDGVWDGVLTASSESDQVLSVLDGAAGYRLGSTIKGGVDYNGDGIADTVIGAPATSSNDTTTWVAIAHGTDDSTGWDIAGRVELQGTAGDRAGSALAHAGDVNGDGYADLIVGAPYANDGDGSAHLLMGPITSGLLSDSEYVFTGSLNSELGSSAVAFDKSGSSYVAIGAPGEAGANLDVGSVSIYDNGGSLYSTIVSSSEKQFSRFGESIAVADLDGDGVAELLIGARNEGDDDTVPSREYSDVPGREGRVYVCSTAGLIGTVDAATLGCTVLAGEAAPHNLGSLVYADGSDLDGDGYADWVLGAVYHDASGSEAGAYYVGSGMPVDGVVTNSADLTLTGAMGSSATGEHATFADTDGDGTPELFVGSLNVNEGRGATYKVDTTVTGTQNLADSAWILYGEGSNDRSGIVANTGDVNGDGADNLVVGATAASYGGYIAGSAYLLGF